MLSGPRALASASETSDYLLHEYLVRNDKAHRTANRWHGGGAEALGLPERVSRRRFVALLEGHVPGTDIRLGRVVDGEHQHRPGWDCTFSAPKSVSLEALLHDNKAVMRAHDASVRAALDWIEAEFLQTRGYDPATGRRPRVKADGLVAATFRHVASRNNDPQLHTHAVIANMTRNAAGEWRSVEPTQLRRNRRLIGAWYRNDLARRLGEMGYVMVPTQVGGLPSFELAGYSPAMLEAFSTRRRDILDYMADKGWKYDAKTAQAATLHTRKRKTGRHRFFLPGHERACDLMSYNVQDGAAKAFVKNELAMREKMSEQARLLNTTKTLLKDCQQERELAATDDLPFVRREDYGAWRLRAERAVDNANSMLDDENKLAPFFKEEPGLRQALAAPSASLGRTMREEDEDWERIKRERAEQKRLEQRRSRNQGLSM